MNGYLFHNQKRKWIVLIDAFYTSFFFSFLSCSWQTAPKESCRVKTSEFECPEHQAFCPSPPQTPCSHSLSPPTGLPSLGTASEAVGWGKRAGQGCPAGPAGTKFSRGSVSGYGSLAGSRQPVGVHALPEEGLKSLRLLAGFYCSKLPLLCKNINKLPWKCCPHPHKCLSKAHFSGVFFVWTLRFTC